MHSMFLGKVEGNMAEISAEDRTHAGRVLRLKPGSLIQVCNGNGQAWEAELQSDFQSNGTARVLRELPAQAKPGLWLGMGILHKADRLEWLVEKAVELGIQGIIPLRTERAMAYRFNASRLKKIMESALKQSQRYWMPQLLDPMGISELCQQNWPEVRRFAFCQDSGSPLEEWPNHSKEAIGLIGPEGDFSSAEVSTLLANGFKPMGLSAFRLRSETAALTMVCKWNQAQGLDQLAMINPLV